MSLEITFFVTNKLTGDLHFLGTVSMRLTFSLTWLLFDPIILVKRRCDDLRGFAFSSIVMIYHFETLVDDVN